MHFQWFKTEHHRLHVIEEWPDGPQKQAALAAVRSKLASLARNLPGDADLARCEVCLNHKERLGLLALTAVPACLENSSADLAA